MLLADALSGVEKHPSVHAEGLAGDVAGVVGGEEQHDRQRHRRGWRGLYFCVERSNVSVSPPTEGGSRAELPFDLPWGESHTAFVTSRLTIGDFSRATHLSVKMLRHYHELGLLEPVDVDVDSGYRRYATQQIVAAQIIRRFRDLEMPLEDIHIVLQAPDVETRN